MPSPFQSVVATAVAYTLVDVFLNVKLALFCPAAVEYKPATRQIVKMGSEETKVEIPREKRNIHYTPGSATCRKPGYQMRFVDLMLFGRDPESERGIKLEAAFSPGGRRPKYGATQMYATDNSQSVIFASIQSTGALLRMGSRKTNSKHAS
jgi:hypothetical protein